MNWLLGQHGLKTCSFSISFSSWRLFFWTTLINEKLPNTLNTTLREVVEASRNAACKHPAAQASLPASQNEFFARDPEIIRKTLEDLWRIVLEFQYVHKSSLIDWYWQMHIICSKEEQQIWLTCSFAHHKSKQQHRVQGWLRPEYNSARHTSYAACNHWHLVPDLEL